MKPFNRQARDQIRVRGHTRFILLYGLLRCGIPFGTFMAVSLFAWGLFEHCTPSAWRVAGEFCFFTLSFGYLSGEFEWRRQERAYHDHAA